MDKEYVKVEVERYEDLVVTEERLRTLENIILNNTEYSEYRKDLRIDDDIPILTYLLLIDTGVYGYALSDKKEKHERENEEE